MDANFMDLIGEIFPILGLSGDDNDDDEHHFDAFSSCCCDGDADAATVKTSPSYSGEKMKDEERALYFLTEAVNTYKSSMTGRLLTSRNEVLKEVSEMTGLGIPMILHALRYGIVRTHREFLVTSVDEKAIDSPSPSPAGVSLS